MMKAIVARVCPHAGARRLLALAGVASAVFGGLWAVSGERDWSGIAGARARHGEVLAQRERAERRLDLQPDSRQDPRSIEPEPSRQKEVPGQSSLDDRSGRSPALPENRRNEGEPLLDPGWQLIASAHDSGLRIRRLGPAQQAGAETAAGGMRYYDVAGDGRFGAIGAWVRSLAALPMAVVPVGIEVQRQADGASFSARLAVSPPGRTRRMSRLDRWRWLLPARAQPRPAPISAAASRRRCRAWPASCAMRAADSCCSTPRRGPGPLRWASASVPNASRASMRMGSGWASTMAVVCSIA